MALGSAAGDPARSARARRERAAHDLSLSARGLLRGDRHGVELAAQSRARHPEDWCSNLGWDGFPLRLAGRSRDMAIYTHRSSPASGRAPASPWRCSSPGCGRWTRTWSRPRRSTARARGGSTPRVLLPTHLADLHHRDRDPAAVRRSRPFDLVRALTGGGPGIATMLPTLVVYDFMFQRGAARPRLGRGGPDAAVAARGAGCLTAALRALAAAKAGTRHEVDAAIARRRRWLIYAFWSLRVFSWCRSAWWSLNSLRTAEEIGRDLADRLAERI